MVDTNILVSAIILDSKKQWEVFEDIFAHHTLVLSTYILDEFNEVAQRKFPEKLFVIDDVLARMPYELAYTPKEIPPHIFDIRDPDDYPLLYTAIIEDVDVLVTNDNDLLVVNIDTPEIITSAEYLGRNKRRS
jgi:putative PIN family toxin of toxin-antitoxin system